MRRDQVVRSLRPATIVSTLAGAMLLSACAQLLPSQNDAAHVSGRVHMGPMCTAVDRACQDAAWVGEVRFTATSGSTVVDVKTDKEGKFELSLAPSSYTISLIGPNPMDGDTYETLPAFHGPSQVDVHASESIALEFAVETGIR